MSELKLCPFCGEEPEIFDFKDGRFVVQCSNSGCDVYPYTSIHRDRADAIAAWNQRATVYTKPTTLSQLQAENAKLREERDHWHVEQVHAYGNWEDAHKRATELEAENDKLRELVKSMYYDLTNMTFPPDWVTDYEADMRELGVEVDA